jgi:hypothetical protein
MDPKIEADEAEMTAIIARLDGLSTKQTIVAMREALNRDGGRLGRTVAFQVWAAKAYNSGWLTSPEFAQAEKELRAEAQQENHQ